MTNRFLSVVPFVLLNLRAPDGSPGGSAAPSGDAKIPEPQGSSLEEKNQSALGIIKDLWSKLTKSSADLQAANDLLEPARAFESQFNAEKSAHETTKGELKTANEKIATHVGELSTLNSQLKTSNERISLVESYAKHNGLDLTGVEKHKAIKEVPEGEAGQSGSELWAQYNSIKKQEAEGKIDTGSAHAFWKKNESALRDFAKSKRTRD